MDEWHVGDPADWGDSVGVPDIPYMGYLQDDDGEDENPPHVSKSDSISQDAWRLRQEGRFSEALQRINEALEYSTDWKCLNIKAIILDDMREYEESIRFYDMALLKTNSQLVRDNKARTLEQMSYRERYSGNLENALDCINQSLKLTGEENDRLRFLQTKSDILKLMGRHREAYVCNKLANKQYDLVDEFERQSEILKNSWDTLICIAARKFYGYAVPKTRGTVVNLIKEPQNTHDSDAIRVEFRGKTVGYVANSKYTLIDEAKSATQIQNGFEKHAKAEIMFLFMERHLVAKVLPFSLKRDWHSE